MADDRNPDLRSGLNATCQSETGVIGLNNDDVQQVVRLGVEPIGDEYVTRPLEHLKPRQLSSLRTCLRRHRAHVRVCCSAGYSN